MLPAFFLDGHAQMCAFIAGESSYVGPIGLVPFRIIILISVMDGSTNKGDLSHKLFGFLNVVWEVEGYPHACKVDNVLAYVPSVFISFSLVSLENFPF